MRAAGDAQTRCPKFDPKLGVGSAETETRRQKV